MNNKPPAQKPTLSSAQRDLVSDCVSRADNLRSQARNLEEQAKAFTEGRCTEAELRAGYRDSFYAR